MLVQMLVAVEAADDSIPYLAEQIAVQPPCELRLNGSVYAGQFIGAQVLFAPQEDPRVNEA